VPAEFVESFGTGAQRFDQIQPFDASSAAFAQSVLVEADHDGWSMIPSSDPRCYNAKYARMPAACANHDGCVARCIEPILYLLYRSVEHLFFHLLALAILLIEFCCEHCPLGLIVSKQ